MKLKGSLIGFTLITCLYLGLLIWLDARKQILTYLPQLWQALLTMMCMALGSLPHKGRLCTTGMKVSSPSSGNVPWSWTPR